MGSWTWKLLLTRKQLMDQAPSNSVWLQFFGTWRQTLLLMRSALRKLCTSYSSVMPGVSTSLASHISHSSSAALTNLTFPVQVKPFVAQQMLRPRNFPSCSAPESGPRNVEVYSYTHFSFAKKMSKPLRGSTHIKSSTCPTTRILHDG